MKEILDDLKLCLYTNNDELFSSWLVMSNCPKISHDLLEESKLQTVVYESLKEIFDVLMRCPQADYFWYTYRENGGRLTWAEPHHDVVPSGALRVDKEKIKVFLRNVKINQLGV